MQTPPLDRRRFLLLLSGMAALPAYGLTPTQPEGPFYPATDPTGSDADLTRRLPEGPVAQGQPLLIRGRVLDAQGAPVAGARVEIWQADTFGHYRHPRDRGRVDPNFQGWGEAITDAGGHYRFHTVKPAPYLAGQEWVRPPHIHFRVSARGRPSLTTQLYFAGDPLNERDVLLAQVPPDRRAALMTQLQPGEGAQVGLFNLVIGPDEMTNKHLLTPADPIS
ncbi:protocatechuate 3,4-dioxygenase [Motiliproteus sp. SC1-56]|uniref:dioxygenase family protein n=1 Tax=Motiliproteus sp. SC1-56 TaxID=2799565 RepID=UPI001A8CE5A6|nr:protocatechuate 3,4-dioxygenase [Motiliproteus sp. SC1-56]